MAYLHCHKCGWSQDDFWSWEWKGLRKFWKWSYRPFGYNPISLVLEDIAQFWVPRYIEYEESFATENGFKTRRILSWRVMALCIKKHVRRLFTQKWWTYRQWKRDYTLKITRCPQCKSADDFDID